MTMPTIKCPKCESEHIGVTGNLQIQFPAKYFNKLSKKAIATKEVNLLGFDWGNCLMTCLECGYGLYGLLDPTKKGIS